ncbi:putative protein-serine/threonine kinase [Helianthus annuus]|nr:putative protein-serine/threonine kinase [Helianthus annuus]
MNPNYTEFRFPRIKPHPWHKVEACVHPFFDELRDPTTVTRFLRSSILNSKYRFIQPTLIMLSEVSNISFLKFERCPFNDSIV